MRSTIAAIILTLAGALSCGMMEDFYEYSGADFRTSIYIQGPTNLMNSHDGGRNFSIAADSVSLVDWYVNTYRELVTVDNADALNNRIFITRPDEGKQLVGALLMGSYTWKTLTAASNGDFYFCVYPSPDSYLWRLPAGGSVIQPVSVMSGFSLPGGAWRLWAFQYNDATRLFVADTSSSQLYLSTDGGMSFTVISPIFNGTINDMIIQGSVIYLTTSSATQAIYQSSDGGYSFNLTGSIISLNSLAIDYSGRKYASSVSTVFFSDDGANWPSTSSFGFTTITDLATDHTGRLYVLSSSPPGLVVSDDRGSTWFELYPLNGTRMQVVEYHD